VTVTVTVTVRENRPVIDPLERWRQYGEKPDYAGLLTYGGAPYTQDPAELAGFDVAIVGAPTDDLVSDRPGARFGPRAIRAASCPPGAHLESKVDAFEELRIVDFGDAAVLPADAERTHAAIEQLVGQAVDAGLVPVVLGGDHSITHPVVQAFDGPLHVVQFDAHLDYARARDTDRYSNAHAFRQISTMDSVSALIQVGIRSLRTEAGLYEDSLADGNRIVPPAELREVEAEGVARLVPERARCFVSIDVDALDMPLVPGCVSAEPGGLTYAELRDTLVAIADRAQIVGIDLVEVNPMVDTAAGATAYLAAHLLVEALDAIAQG